MRRRRVSSDEVVDVLGLRRGGGRWAGPRSAKVSVPVALLPESCGHALAGVGGGGGEDLVEGRGGWRRARRR